MSKEIIFLIEEAEEGGYVARALEQIPVSFTRRILRLRGKLRHSAQDATVNQSGNRYRPFDLHRGGDMGRLEGSRP